MVKKLIVAGASFLALMFVPSVASARPVVDSGPAYAPSKIKAVDVFGVYTKEQRSLLVSMGYDIGEAAWADHVELFGDPLSRRRLQSGLGVLRHVFARPSNSGRDQRRTARAR